MASVTVGRQYSTAIGYLNVKKFKKCVNVDLEYWIHLLTSLSISIADHCEIFGRAAHNRCLIRHSTTTTFQQYTPSVIGMSSLVFFTVISIILYCAFL